MVTKNITRYIDLVFCVVFLPAMVTLLPLDRWLDTNPQFVALLLVWLYATYALHRVLTIPFLFAERKRYFAAFVLLVVSFVLTYLLTRYQIAQPAHIARRIMDSPQVPQVPRKAIHMHQQAVWFLYIVVTTFSVVVALLSELNRQIVVRQSVEFEKERAELSLYKAQINPHFLFNTLNTLLGLVVTKSDKAEDAIVQFTSLMRYMCHSSTQNQVPLHTEVEYIEEYIALQRYRLSDHTEVNFISSIDDESKGCQITPMLLITFVENALKYGASSQFASVINVELRVDDGELSLNTCNPIFKTHKSEQGAGIGITNCRKRLELLYHSRYSLRIVESGSEYKVLMNIKLV